MLELDWGLVLQKLIRYLIEGITIGLVGRFLLRQSKLEDIIVLSICAASVLCLLDTFLPLSGSSARFGVGLGAGLNLIG